MGSNFTRREALAVVDVAEIARSVADPRVRILQQPYNMGKGAALRRGFAEATADFVVVQGRSSAFLETK